MTFDDIWMVALEKELERFFYESHILTVVTFYDKS